MILAYIIWWSAALSVVGSIWSLVSRSRVALQLVGVGLAGVLSIVGGITVQGLSHAGWVGLIETFKESFQDWELILGFHLPLTASIIASTIAFCLHWRRT